MAGSTTDTKQTIMDAARVMVQARGYNALSFREVAKEVGIKSASIHYHFPTKGDLGAALARQYTEDAIAFFDNMTAASLDLTTCMDKYAAIFRAALVNNNRMCLCGILAAEYDDLPPEVRVEVDRFTDANVSWLTQLLSARKSKLSKEQIKDQALAIFSAMEGAQLVARGRGDVAAYDQTIKAYKIIGLIPS
jgi:TetR/AcrR family transcriptional repressor of nem operon